MVRCTMHRFGVDDGPVRFTGRKSRRCAVRATTLQGKGASARAEAPFSWKSGKGALHLADALAAMAARAREERV